MNSTDLKAMPQLPLPPSSRTVAAPKQKKKTLSRRMGVVIAAPLSDLITFQAANI